jgi:hypothetical protein
LFALDQELFDDLVNGNLLKSGFHHLAREGKNIPDFIFHAIFEAAMLSYLLAQLHKKEESYPGAPEFEFSHIFFIFDCLLRSKQKFVKKYLPKQLGHRHASPFDNEIFIDDFGPLSFEFFPPQLLL